MIIFQRKRDVKSLCLLLLITFAGCSHSNVYTSKATDNCNNLNLFIGLLFPKETIELYYNDKLILKYRVDSLDGYQFNKRFCIDYKPIGALKLKSFYKGKNYLDTVLLVRKEKFGYELNVTMPHPANWKKYIKDGKPVPETGWGYLPIDKSIRFISLLPDTTSKNTFIY